MFVVRIERRNREGRITLVMEKEFRYIYGVVATRWIKQELNEAIHAKDTVTITNITPNEEQ